MVYVIAGAAVVVIVAAILLLRRRASNDGRDLEASTTPPARAEDEPMTGLEAALAQVTDREGRPIGERIDAESDLVDELRVPDDTGPLLRRALDRVEHDDAEDGDDEGDPARAT